MTSPLSQAELRATLGESGFLRKAATDNALFVTDLPRRQPQETLVDKLAQLEHCGFCAALSPNGLWLIDLSEPRWALLEAQWQAMPRCGFPQQPALHPAYALYRLLYAHPAPWRAQPREPLRALLKRYDQPAELLGCLPALTQTCAARLREHLPLPSAGAGLLCQWLCETEGGDKLDT